MINTYLYTWRAVYGDGSFLDEFSENGEKISFSSVEKSRCVCLVVFKKETGEEFTSININPENGQIPVFFRRHYLCIDGSHDTSENPILPTLTCLGWENKNKDQSSYTFITSEGVVFVSDDINVV